MIQISSKGKSISERSKLYQHFKLAVHCSLVGSHVAPPNFDQERAYTLTQHWDHMPVSIQQPLPQHSRIQTVGLIF